MSIASTIQNIDLAAPFKAYHKYIGKTPLAEIPLLAAAGGAAGYYGGGALAKTILHSLLIGKSEQEKAEIIRDLEADNTLQDISKWIGVIGGLIGAGYGVAKHVNPYGRGSDAIKSLTQYDYWNKPENKLWLDILKQKRLARDINRPTSPFGYINYFDPGRSGPAAFLMQKTQAFDSFGHDDIPIYQTIEVIKRDPFLTVTQKQITNVLLEGAETKDTGLVSGKDIMYSALRMGVGAASAYLFGKAVGNIMSLPPPLTDRLSLAGGVAGALVNSGIFEETNK